MSFLPISGCDRLISICLDFRQARQLYLSLAWQLNQTLYLSHVNPSILWLRITNDESSKPCGELKAGPGGEEAARRRERDVERGQGPGAFLEEAEGLEAEGGEGGESSQQAGDDEQAGAFGQNFPGDEQVEDPPDEEGAEQVDTSVPKGQPAPSRLWTPRASP